MRFGAVADAFAHQTFSVTKKVDGELPENAKDLEYTLNITLKNDADPSVNKTYQATVKAGKRYSYPGTLPLGTEVTVSEGAFPLPTASPGTRPRVACSIPLRVSHSRQTTVRLPSR